ncbi:hypothetical protein WDM22_33035 [Bradyrhizobium septentrionale]|uniref:hypothetical protein n=1 Tax=Bradyrhizobium septentrionale TaxID=1404411 RepID=UPI0030CD5435
MSKKVTSQIEGNAIISEIEEMPGYFPEDYHEHLVLAGRKFDNLDRLSVAELEASLDDEKVVDDWDLERAKRAKILDRWLQETKGVISELMKLFHSLRESQSLLEEKILERAGSPPRQSRGRSARAAPETQRRGVAHCFVSPQTRNQSPNKLPALSSLNENHEHERAGIRWTRIERL